MVTFLHRLAHLTAAVLVTAFLCQCTTTEVKSTRTKFSFAGDGDEAAIRNRFAESGYTVAEDGSIQADNPNLYEGKKPRGLKGEFESRQARFKKDTAATKEYRTPEYLRMQDYRGVKDSRDSSTVAREGGFQQSRQAGKLFKSRTKTSSEYASYDAGTFRDSGQTFGTSQDKAASGALQNAAVAEGQNFQMGYRDNAALSMNDVKKMISPGVYARATGIE